MFARRTWYYAGWSHELGEKPFTRRLLDEQVAHFRDGAGTAHAIGALCPHHGTDLGQGKVVDGAVQCPFHGWRFNGEGACVKIPSQLDDAKIPPTARVLRYPLIERQGNLWIWMDATAEPDHEPTHLEFFEEQPGRRRTFIPAQMIDAPFVNVVENALDYAHLKFIHFGTMDVKSPLLPEQTLEIQEDGRGLKSYFAEDSGQTERDAIDPAPARGLFGRLSRWSGFSRAGVEDSYGCFHLGGVAYYYDRYKDGRIRVIYGGITPADDTHTWFFEETVRCFALGPIGEWATVRWMQKLLDEDSSLLRDTVLANGAGGLERPVSVTSDRAGLAFRRLHAAALAAEYGEEAEAAE